jgi:hypothetical protein
MSERYPQPVVERMILNLHRHGKTEEAYDAMFDCPELVDEIEENDLTCAQLLDRIRRRNVEV